jgi:hypothetical protein
MERRHTHVMTSVSRFERGHALSCVRVHRVVHCDVLETTATLVFVGGVVDNT